MIEKLDLAGYFLIVWDVVRFCLENRILVQGRGSAANSAVCYALSITAVDPVKMELLFERFLSEERGEWPDIDLDLPSGDQRERVIQHVYEKYGPHGAGMTANVITYRDRSSAREVRQGPRLFARAGGRAVQAARRLELRRDPRSARGARGRDRARPASIPRSGARGTSCASSSRSRTCRATSASTRAASSSRRGASTRSSRSSPRPCRAASSCSGTRTTAPTSGS